LYIGVPPLPYDSSGIGGNPFSDQVSDIRGWDTQLLVGQIKDPATGINGGDDCETYYNFCRPLGAVISLPNCSTLLAMCVPDPVFVQDFLPDSSLLAGRQYPKLTKREQYLKDLIGHVTALANALPADGIPPPITALANDVQSKLDALIAVNEADKKKPPILPNWATYVWQSPPPKGSPPGTRGYWHAVKVEVLLPKRCYVNGVRDYDNFDCCAGNGTTTGENKDRFPWVRAYNADWLLRKCYEMWDENGCVKVRVSRFDEDHSLKGSVIKFLNQLPLWQFLYRHPLHAGDSLDAAIQTIGSGNCAGADANAAGAYITSNADSDSSSAICYPAAEALIQQGFISETCARYELDTDPANPDRWTYNLMFRDCKNCCLKLPLYHKLPDD
jgi:hypothetical protein